MKVIPFLFIMFFILFWNCQYENDEDLYPEYFKQDSIIGGMIAHYMLDGNAIDTSNSNIHGILFGNPQVTDDRYGNTGSALYFDGVDDYILAEIGFYDPLAISLWFAHKNNDITKSYVIFDYGLNAVRSEVDMTSGATLTYGYINDTNVISMFRSKMKYSYEMIWHHLYIDSGSDTTLPKMYIDGFYEGFLDEKKALDVLSGLIYFGRAFNRNETEALYFDGKIDDIRIFNRILGEEEILSLFNNFEAE